MGFLCRGFILAQYRLFPLQTTTVQIVNLVRSCVVTPNLVRYSYPFGFLPRRHRGNHLGLCVLDLDQDSRRPTARPGITSGHKLDVGQIYRLEATDRPTFDQWQTGEDCEIIRLVG